MVATRNNDDESRNQNLKIKWGRQIFDVDLNQCISHNHESQSNDQNFATWLRMKLHELTSVPPKDQTLIFGRKKINYGDQINFLDIVGQKVLLLGEALSPTDDEKSSQAAENTASVNSGRNATEETDHRLTFNDKIKKLTKYDIKDFIGLKNFQNTCFMNSVIQSLKNLPYFRKLIRFESKFDLQIQGMLIELLKNLINDMCYGNDATHSMTAFVAMIRINLQCFNDRNELGIYLQQDAHDFLIYIFNHIEEIYSMLQIKDNLLIKTFQYIMHSETKNLEDTSEEPIIGEEKNYVLNLHINSETNNLYSCLKNAMIDKLRKISDYTNKECEYERIYSFKRLPKYLCLTLTRFYFKEDILINAKILKSIEFPLQIDLFEFCCPELRQKLTAKREEFKKVQKHSIDHVTNQYHLYDDSCQDDELASGTGLYEIKSIITHQGRSSDSGHYISWLKPPICDIGPGVEPFWFKMDDNNISKVSIEEILNLKGGADTHIAYIFILGPKEIVLPI